MSSHAPRSSYRNRDSGYWVAAPRTTDAIGFVLRDAYARDRALPDEMEELLGQLCQLPDSNGRSDTR